MSQHRPTASSITARLPRVLAVAAAALATGGLLAACGGSSDPSASGAAGERASEEQAETKLADFARCMREHGVQAETATGPGGGHGIKIGGPAGGEPKQGVMEAAQKACAKYQPTPKSVNLSPAQKVEVEEKLQKFARCMREHGIKVETSTKGGGIQIGIHNSASGAGPNPESPGFQAAQRTCQSLLPRPPGAKGKAGLFPPGPATGESKSDGSGSGAAGFSATAGGN